MRRCAGSSGGVCGRLRSKIGGMLFERTALSRKPQLLADQELAKLREEDILTPDLVFRDPYFLDVRGNADGADPVRRQG